MRIDSHQHFWRYTPREYAWIDDTMGVLRRDFLPSDLEPLLRGSQIDGCVAAQAQETIEETLWLLELADRHDTQLMRQMRRIELELRAALQQGRLQAAEQAW